MTEIKVGRHNEPGAVYIGRAMPRLNRKASPLANPFRMRSEADRDEVCNRYEDWLQDQLAAENEAVCNEIDRLTALAHQQGGLTLGCFCAPKRCHGDSIKRVINQQLLPIVLAENGWQITFAEDSGNDTA